MRAILGKAKVKLRPSRSSSAPPPTPEADPRQHPTTAPQSTATSEKSAPAVQETPDPKAEPRVNISTVQSRLWREAYDEVKKTNPKLVDAYESILSANWRDVQQPDSDPSGPPLEPVGDDLSDNPEVRRRQMHELIQDGLNRTERQASVMEHLSEATEFLRSVGDIVQAAVSGSSEAALAWVPVSMGLELLSGAVTETGENRSGLSYVLSRMEWYWNLAALLLDENKAKTSLSELRHELEKHIVQLYSKILDYQMSSIARYGRHRVTVLARDGIKLDDWASRIEDIKAAETAVETAMAQYNTREIILELQEFADSAKRMEATLANISSAIQDQTRQQAKWRDDDKYKDFMRNLYATDPREDKKRIEVTKGTLIPGSFNWILQNDEYQKWQTDPQSSLLWIKGHPGKGKTMLMCGVVDALAQTNKTLAYFFCQATEARLNNATAVLRGLLYLLVDQRPQLFSHLRERYEKSGDTLFQDTNSWYALDGMFQKAVDSEDLETTFIVIDALDECVLDLQMLLDFIVRHSGSNPHIKWIVSGRDWEEIAEGLAKAKQKVRLELELNQDSISKAVDHFIDVKVDELDEVKIYGQDLKESVRQRLKENAQGTFLWAALVCQELAGLGVRKRHTLQLLDSIPSGLDSLYRRMWEKMDSSRDAALCQEILAIVLVVYRPITLNELRGLSQSFEDFDLEEMEEVVRGCGSFLTIVGSTIYFVHLSAKDFLLKEPELALSRGIAYYHHAVFARSLQVLSTTLERDICRLGSPGISSFDIEHSQTKPLWRIHYACAYWIDHLAKSTPEKVREALQDQGNVHIFMRTKFLYWLEALSIKDEVSGTFKSMEGLEEKARSQGAEQLSELVKDARRFIVYNRQSIDSYPLQIYASALVFSPQRSRIRQLFRNEEPGWIVSGPDVDMEWSACVQTVKHRSPESLVARQVHPADSRYGIDSLAWSADGRRLASASLLVMQAQDEAAQDAEDTLIRLGCTINLFDIIEGVRIFVLSFDGSRIGQICLPEDGWGLASTDQGILVATKEVAQRWKPSALEAEREDFERHPGVISWKFVEVLDAATGATLSKFEFGPDVHRLTLSANGEWAAATEYCGDNESGPVGTAQIWNVKAGTCRGSFKVNHGHSLSEALSADGQRFLTVEETDTMSPGNSFLWDTTTGTCLKVFKSSRAAACLLSEDGQRGAFMVQGADMAQYQVHNLGTADGACQTLLIDDEAEPSQRFMSLSADGQRLAVSNRGSVPAIEVWDVATDSITQVAKCGEKRMDLSAFSPNGQRLASTMTNQKFIQIWDLTANLPQEDSSVDMSGRQATSTSHVTPALRKRPTDDDSITVLSADGHWISTFHSGPSSLAVMDAQTGEVLRDFENFESTGRELVRAHLSADGRRMAFSEGKTSVDDERVRICDVATGCTLAVFPVDCLVHTLILSSDGRWLTAQVSNRVAVWDVDGGTLRGMATLEAEAAKERFLTGISTDGRRVVGHDGRGEVAVMELEKDVYVETARFQSHAPLSPDAVFYTLFEVTSRDCRRLALWSSRAKKVNIWDLDKSVLLQTLTIEAPGMLHRVAFVGQSNSVLRTNLGSWNLECPDATSAKQKGDSVASDACVAGYGISGDGEWIVKDAERLLWIPLEYRPDSYMVHESTIDFQGRDVVAYTIGLGPS